MTEIDTDPSGPAIPSAPDRDLVVLLAQALRLAGDAGRPVAASQLAAKAWWLLRERDPAGATRINGVMHHLARLPEEPEDLTNGDEHG